MPDRKLKPEYAGLEPFKGQFIQWSYIERKQPKEIRKLFKPIFNEELEETGHQHHLTCVSSKASQYKRKHRANTNSLCSTKQWATRKTKWYKEFGIEKKGQGPSEDQLQKLDSLRLWFVDGQPYEQPQTFSEDPKSQLTLSKRFELRRQQPDKILPELENEGESRVGGAYQRSKQLSRPS
ncbi:uncharacterized protein KY384_001364 [Bacidia gigantensis]|uniref:uncharacterized protein n=1 Tax=Bacidia gigantensis TaxID=2732470 RepID=UPI001D058D35|nr:uncharacterized protein KY384_001364 [Bacidia gigantensis]KAG8533624.1 hypothetical protein KY384_001364 [Bacidia gigantensis]